MAKITLSLSAKSNLEGKRELLLRASLPGNIRLRLKSGLYIPPANFKDGKIKKPRIINSEYMELQKLEQQLSDIEVMIMEYTSSGGDLTKESIEKEIQKRLRPKQERAPKIPKTDKNSIPHLWDSFLLAKSEVSLHWLSQYRNLLRILLRYEMYTKKKLNVATFDPNAFIQFYRDEPRIYQEHPEIYLKHPSDTRPNRLNHKPMPRGDNAVCDITKKLATFFNWCVSNGIIPKSPMSEYKGVRSERYGTPVYLTIQERERLYKTPMGQKLGMQRDIFVFQCLVGCRVGDLYSFTSDNISDGILQYIPGKTKKDRLETIRVPLSPTAMEIWSRYGGELPLVSQQKYNIAIKKACRIAGIDRIVTIINPTTGKDERKPLWQVVSSHTARKTFVGKLYKQVKDPNLVGSLSGHKEGSRAFARYRDIDDDLRKDVISLLE